MPFSLDPLDSKLVLPKPKNSVEDEKVLLLEEQRRAIYTRKRDGHCVHLVINNRGCAQIYTRGNVREISANFPHLIEELETIKLPKNSLFACELIAEKDGKDWREHVASLSATEDSKEAIEKQRRDGLAKLMVFNVFILDGKDVSTLTNEQRIIEIVQDLFFVNFKHVIPVEILNKSFVESQKFVSTHRWEGLVVYDSQAVSTYRLDSNPDRPPRPEGCWKRKPSYEDDFVVTGWVPGTKGKRHEGRMGKLVLAQAHPSTGSLIPCGEVGIGFSDQERDYFANDGLYPLVAQVEYERRFPPRTLSKKRIQCALCNPRFVRLRDDKNAEGCLLPEELVSALPFK